jgi:hypothetical protein
MAIPIDKIRVGKRFRKDLGNHGDINPTALQLIRTGSLDISR